MKEEYITEKGERSYIFLLDEYLKIETIGQISANLVEKIVDNVTDMSYRKAEDKITKHTNQSISHTAVWDIVQKNRRKDRRKRRKRNKVKQRREIKR